MSAPYVPNSSTLWRGFPTRPPVEFCKNSLSVSKKHGQIPRTRFSCLSTVLAIACSPSLYVTPHVEFCKNSLSVSKKHGQIPRTRFSCLSTVLTIACSPSLYVTPHVEFCKNSLSVSKKHGQIPRTLFSCLSIVLAIVCSPRRFMLRNPLPKLEPHQRPSRETKFLQSIGGDDTRYAATKWLQKVSVTPQPFARNTQPGAESIF
jgi:hypothetical protein